MRKQEQNLDDNNRPLILLGFTKVDVEVGRRIIKKVRIAIMRDGKCSLIRRDRLNQLNLEEGEANGVSEYARIVDNITERQDTEILKQKFLL